jgi:hypothetical protein
MDLFGSFSGPVFTVTSGVIFVIMKLTLINNKVDRAAFNLNQVCETYSLKILSERSKVVAMLHGYSVK